MALEELRHQDEAAEGLPSPISELDLDAEAAPRTLRSSKRSRKRSSSEDLDQGPAKKIKSESQDPSPAEIKLEAQDLAPANIKPERHPLVSTPPKDSKWHDDETSDASTEEDECGVKSFGQDTFMHQWEALESQDMLDFYLAYPHNRNATLCEYHFLTLSEKWYQRRKPGVQKTLEKMFKAKFGSEDTPDFSSLGLPVDQDTWDLRPLNEFMGDLSRQIEKAKVRLEKEHDRATAATGHVPLCEVGPKDENLRCALCPEDEEELIPVEHMTTVPEAWDMEVAVWAQKKKEGWEKDVLTCGHASPVMILTGKCLDLIECEVCGHTQPAEDDANPQKYEVRIADIRIPVKVCPSQMPMNSRVGHGDVGGIHFIVDICSRKAMIKFRSTRFSQAHEAEGRGVGRDHCVADELCDNPGAYKVTGCSDYFTNCSCN